LLIVKLILNILDLLFGKEPLMELVELPKLSTVDPWDGKDLQREDL
jgi:hypothetical protein